MTCDFIMWIPSCSNSTCFIRKMMQKSLLVERENISHVLKAEVRSVLKPEW